MGVNSHTHTVTRVGLCWVKFRDGGGKLSQAFGWNGFDWGVGFIMWQWGAILQQRERAGDRQREGERLERWEGEGRRLSDSGIRQLGRAAWLEADLIVHLSLAKSLCKLEKRRESCLAHKVPFFNIIFLRDQFIWFTNKIQQNLFFKRTCWNFAPFVWGFFLGFILICHGTVVGMVVYLKKSLHSLLSVFKKKGECWFTPASRAQMTLMLLNFALILHSSVSTKADLLLHLVFAPERFCVALQGGQISCIFWLQKNNICWFCGLWL